MIYYIYYSILLNNKTKYIKKIKNKININKKKYIYLLL